MVADVVPTPYLRLVDETQLVQLAEQLANLSNSTVRLYLTGPLGAGKSAFARAYLRACGVSGAIKSPSFSVVEVYEARGQQFAHFDFYRLGDPRAWQEMGLRDYFSENARVLVEWPSCATGLPPPDIDINLDFVEADHQRQLSLTAWSEQGKQWLSALFDA